VQPQLVATLEYLVRCSVPGIRLCAVALAEALVPSVTLDLIMRRLLPSLTTLLYGADEEVRWAGCWGRRWLLGGAVLKRLAFCCCCCSCRRLGWCWFRSGLSRPSPSNLRADITSPAPALVQVQLATVAALAEVSRHSSGHPAVLENLTAVFDNLLDCGWQHCSHCCCLAALPITLACGYLGAQLPACLHTPADRALRCCRRGPRAAAGRAAGAGQDSVQQRQR
jgi:hypothetical protein